MIGNYVLGNAGGVLSPDGGGGGGATLVFSYPSFNSSQVVSNSTTSGTNLVNLSGGTVGLSGSTILYPTSIGGHEAAGVWYTTQVNIQAFTCDFTFQQDPGVYGMFFCVQNSNTTTNSGSGTFYGVNAVADANGEGYGSYPAQPNTQIGNSVAINFGQTNINNQCPGLPANFSSTGVFVSGGPEGASFAPCEDMQSIGINLHANHVMTCHVVYDGTLLTMLLTDTVTGVQARRSWPTNIPQVLGSVPGPGPSNLGWVGLTGGGVGNGPGGNAGRNILSSWAYYTGYNPRLATPTFSVASGSYAGTQTVTISGPVGVSIYYSTNGIDPGNTASSNTSLYSAPLTVSAGQILKAVAVQSGYTDSFVAAANYQIGSTSLPRINFPTNFAGATNFLSVCGQASIVSNTLELAIPEFGGSGAFWYLTPINITAFTAVFTLNLPTSTSASTGLCFVIQNEYAQSIQGANSGGPFALNNGSTSIGNNMGYGGPDAGGGINQSVALAFDQSNNLVGLYTNGVTPTGSSTSPSPVSLNAGHALQVSLTYSGTTLSGTITDTVTSSSFPFSYTVNIASIVGANTAYVGFTLQNGAASTQQITNWTVS